MFATLCHTAKVKKYFTIASIINNQKILQRYE